MLTRLRFYLRVQLGKHVLKSSFIWLLWWYSAWRVEALTPHCQLTGEHSDSCHMGFSNMVAYFIKPARVSASKTEIIICCKLILKVGSHHLCHIVLAATMLLSPDRTAGEAAKQWHKYKDAGSLQAILEVCLPHKGTFWTWSSFGVLSLIWI